MRGARRADDRSIGMAKTRERKLEVAKKIYEIVVGEYGLKPEDLIYDDLTFTLATGDAEWIDSAVETIEGIRLIKRELPGVYTSLGVSNVSFGLAPEARSVLNSVFLHHCVEAGLDMAIVNPAHVQPYAEISSEERTLADELVFNRRLGASRFADHFDKTGVGSGSKRKIHAGMTNDQKVLDGRSPEKGRHGRLTRRACARRQCVLNEVLLSAMKEVGDVRRCELILPFVLQSAEVMKKAVTSRGFLERAEGYTKGGRAGNGVRRRARHRKVARQHDPLEQRLHGGSTSAKVPVNTIIDKAIEVARTRLACPHCSSRRRSRCRCAYRSSTGAE
jgi:5-methyltetrahydrofolate--homocysteine methyltransferase